LDSACIGALACYLPVEMVQLFCAVIPGGKYGRCESRCSRNGEDCGRHMLGWCAECDRGCQTGAAKLGKPRGVGDECVRACADGLHDCDWVCLVLAEQADDVRIGNELAHRGTSLGAEGTDRNAVGDTE